MKMLSSFCKCNCLICYTENSYTCIHILTYKTYANMLNTEMFPVEEGMRKRREGENEGRREEGRNEAI